MSILLPAPHAQVCKHTYGRAAITEHIRIGGRSAGGASCPVAGCSHKVTLGDLIEDKEMKRRVRKACLLVYSPKCSVPFLLA